jgi:hypothetical protein
MQTRDLDERRVWACEVEVAEKAERRVPGDRFAMNPMPGEEAVGDLV